MAELSADRSRRAVEARQARRRPVVIRHGRVVVLGPIGKSDVPGLWKGALHLLAVGDPDPIDYDVGALTEPDCATVDALARVALLARRRGRRIQLSNAGPALRELIVLAGLSEVVPCAGDSGVEPGRQAE